MPRGACKSISRQTCIGKHHEIVKMWNGVNRSLIVNADDFNLTAGVSRAVLQAHQQGIVSSTSVFTNLPFSSHELDALKSSPHPNPLPTKWGEGRLRGLKPIGIGLHLNATFGRPTMPVAHVSSLLDASGFFKRFNDYARNHFQGKELFWEYSLQLLRFETIFKRMPDHLNTHHHLHVLPNVFEIVRKIAEKYKIPVRRVPVIGMHPKIQTTNYFFGNLSPDKHWTRESLASILKNLPDGTSEIMCHPGMIDSELVRKSSFVAGRRKEFHLFSNSSLKCLLDQERIKLIPRI
ncbi:MAG: ChbG/HpnK family deacetylase [Candidatus Omnitrophica bacterium]|nr:ChbG/HpnK family deacetylase [Candidatus Omnitrophota bacterium]